jgi:hypothetical protein
MAKILVNVRVTQAEFDLLETYAKQTERTKTDILRSLIRNLKVE